jgi:hypothetical protein
MTVLTDDQKAQLGILVQQRKELMLELSRLEKGDELNKKFLLGQLQDTFQAIKLITHPT